VGHLVRSLAPHGHIVAIHNGPVRPSFGVRFRSDPAVINTVMFQTWGTTGEQDGWLAAGIEEVIAASLGDWQGSAVLSEWGYEFAEDLPPIMLGHRWCGPDHTRRGAWRGVFSGLGIVHGFHFSWGPYMVLDRDQPGMADLLQVRTLVERIGLVRETMRPAPELVQGDDGQGTGYAPRALASEDRERVAIYLPAGGSVTVSSEVFPSNARWTWIDPRTGDETLAIPARKRTFIAPVGDDDDPSRPADWLLVLA
ncbi:MAG: putative collagen-binding domain-containing protein, partial [Thermomicrobiales bacterium]